MIDVNQFLKDFPQFDTSLVTDPNKVNIPPTSISFWLTIAYQMLNAQRWGAQLDLAAEMFAAHNVILEVLATRDMAVGGVPGVATGMVAGKQSADVSITYNNAAVIDPRAEHWNYTIYGQRLWHMIQMFGAGPIYVGAGCAPFGSGPAWSGFWVYNFPSPSM